jgi:hypothetical protein
VCQTRSPNGLPGCSVSRSVFVIFRGEIIVVLVFIIVFKIPRIEAPLPFKLLAVRLNLVESMCPFNTAMTERTCNVMTCANPRLIKSSVFDCQISHQEKHIAREAERLESVVVPIWLRKVKNLRIFFKSCSPYL